MSNLEKGYEVRTCSVCIPCGLAKCKDQPCHKVHRKLDSDPFICEHGHDITFKFQREQAFATKFFKTRQEHKECGEKREKLITSLKQKLDEANITISHTRLLYSTTLEEQESNQKIIRDMNQSCILAQIENAQLREIIKNLHFNQLMWLQHMHYNQIPKPLFL